MAHGKKLATVIVLAGTMMVPLSVQAATGAQVNNAIAQGLAHLASTQAVNGSWNTYTGYPPAETGSAVLAFIEQGNTETTGPYSTNVQNGLSYLFGTAIKDGSGRIHWASEDTYQTGIALSAIAATKTPSAVVGSGPLAGMTYQQVTQGVVNYFVDGQNVNNDHWKGSWGYGANYGSGDNSITQWPVIGMIFAKTDMGISIPAAVSTNLMAWTDTIQYLDGSHTGIDGSSGYQFNNSLNSLSKTGGMLLEFYLEGRTKSDPDVQAALGFINRNWISGGNFAGSPWDGNFGQAYSMWSVYKGLQVILGLNDNSVIDNLRSAGVTDPGVAWNWYQDYTDWLVNNQNPDGSWDGYSYWGGALSDSWYINILLATQIAPNPEEVPEPAALGLMGLGLLGLAALRRRKTV